jgi:hypothetical protein
MVAICKIVANVFFWREKMCNSVAKDISNEIFLVGKIKNIWKNEN